MIKVEDTLIKERNYALWVFYCLNHEAKIYSDIIEGSARVEKNIIDLDIEVNEEVHGDTLIFIFHRTNRKGNRLYSYKKVNFNHIIIKKSTCKVMGIIADFAETNQYKECIENFDKLNTCPVLPQTGEPSPFPIAKSEKKFISILKNTANLEKRNIWLYSYLKYEVGK